MPCWLVEGHFEHNYSKMPSVKRNRTLRFKLSGTVYLLSMGNLA